MTIETKPFGKITITEKQKIFFASGLLGFQQYCNYALLDSSQHPFFWLQSLDEPKIAFILINPYLAEPQYLLNISEADMQSIQNPEPNDLLVFSTVTIPKNRTQTSCNLLGPIIINRALRIGHQAISLDSQWSTKHLLMSRAS